MTIENDETLQIYLEESLEHLADIENDFLEIERTGEDINEELVNKVYRAAHSIKGGAGFMGLTIIKDLTHEMENVLGKIRSRELVPNPEIINILLMASDALKELIEDVFNSNDADISQHIEALKAVAEGAAIPESSTRAETDGRKQRDTRHEQVESEDPAHTAEDGTAPGMSDSGRVQISFPDGHAGLSVTQAELDLARDELKQIYLVEMDLIQDVHSKGRTPVDYIEELKSCGNILDSNLDVDAVGTLEDSQYAESLCFRALFASILKPNDINSLFQVDEKNIFLLTDEMSVIPIAKPKPVEKVISKPVEKSKVAKKTAPPKAKSPEPEVNDAKTKSPQKNAVDTENRGNWKESKDTPKDSASTGTAQDTSLRVNVSLLDSLMNLAGELVLSRNQLLQAIGSGDKRASENAGQRVDLITSELQETIMLTRMQAIGNVFNKFPRVVRDLSRKLGKDVEIVLEGNDVEMDKTIIEAINDPLTHLVRNSVDHGIEAPSERLSAGKDPKGHVKLKAYHEAGQVNIEIVDDGKGLDGKKLAEVAVAKGLISEEQTSIMSEKEKVNLIFLPGFSTAREVTDVSGRGVGMDVVKTNLDKLGGVIDVDSEFGHGTSIRIKLPLTLAIIPSQIIYAGKERYAIPQVNLEELLRIPAAQIKTRIEMVGDAEVVRLRGNLLPLLKLSDVIGIDQVYLDPNTKVEEKDRRRGIADRRCKKSPLFENTPVTDMNDSDSSEDPESSEQRVEPKERRYHTSSALNIVVVSTGSMKYGLVVDELHDSEEIVVKPLGRHLKQCKGYAGATIMGDGKVALILDVGNLAKMAQLTSLSGTDRAAEISREAKEARSRSKDRQSLLVFRNAAEEQFVVPLNQVERIEKVKTEQIEEVGGKKVLQYRGGSLPLFSVDQVADVKPLQDAEELLIIVFNISKKGVGLMAMGPVDVMEASVEFDGTTIRQPGILGSTIINDRTTLLIDIYGIVKALNPEWIDAEKEDKGSQSGNYTVLVAEDSNFFRNQVKGFMEEEGYHVIEAEDGLDAYHKLTEHADTISLVCTDIEMPNLDGFGFTEKIRANPHFDGLPVVALTTLASDEDITRGRQVGIDEYHIKLDKENLMKSVKDYLVHGRTR